MAEPEKKEEMKEEKERRARIVTKPKKEEKERREEKEIRAVTLIRILGTDIPGEMNIYSGLTRIKGISWAFSNAICNALKLDKMRKISSLTQKEIDDIIAIIKKPPFPGWMLDRRKDLETGQDRHLVTTDLELQREFDIRRLKGIKSLRGWRHVLGQPVRGQRTRSHFRKGRAVGVQKAKVRLPPAEEKEKKK